MTTEHAQLVPPGPVSPPSGEPMLEFIDAVHGSLDLAKLGAYYMETIPRLVRPTRTVSTSSTLIRMTL